MHFLLAILLLLSYPLEASQTLGKVPVAYKGRFRPIEAYSYLWLYHLSNKSTIQGINSPNDTLLQMHILGHASLDSIPLFSVNQSKTKALLNLDLKTNRFSYNQLHQALMQSPPSQPSEDLTSLLSKIREYEAGGSLNFLPSKRPNGEWLPLSSLKIENNLTRYSTEHFTKIKSTYLALENALRNQNSAEIEEYTEALSQNLLNAYATIAGTVYLETVEKTLTYPTMSQLEAEYIYYHYPLGTITIIAYGLVLVIFLLSRKYTWLALIPFGLHTLLLGLRCYVLWRPPVSNMFETVVYVPWIAVLTGFVFYYLFNNRVVLGASIFITFLFLIFLRMTHLDSGMENVQAVLDSQFWLMIHVLMVVGSYGLFILGGTLGHLYLGMGLYYRKETPSMTHLANNIIQTIYIGTALLITGTILGGVWAAESWGRFWDWDPKESWAFISSCIYLIWIHLYTFKHIGNFGLAVGSIIGLTAIGFTWYGVNYILGTGLHSYGFGSGGEQFFYLYISLEAIFLAVVYQRHKYWLQNI